MERLSERLTAIEAVLKKLEPVEGLLERVALLENTIYTTKKVFTFQEACMYIGVSESMLYKTHIEQGNPALQASRQDALLCEGRAGRVALAKLRTYGGRCHAYGDGSVRNPTVL